MQETPDFPVGHDQLVAKARSRRSFFSTADWVLFVASRLYLGFRLAHPVYQVNFFSNATLYSPCSAVGMFSTRNDKILRKSQIDQCSRHAKSCYMYLSAYLQETCKCPSSALLASSAVIIRHSNTACYCSFRHLLLKRIGSCPPFGATVYSKQISVFQPLKRDAAGSHVSRLSYLIRLLPAAPP